MTIRGPFPIAALLRLHSATLRDIAFSFAALRPAIKLRCVFYDFFTLQFRHLKLPMFYYQADGR